MTHTVESGASDLDETSPAEREVPTGPTLAVFDLPFPVEISPDLEDVRQLHEDWMVDQGLLVAAPDDARSVDRYRRFDLPRLAALVWPYAMGADLKLGCDVVGWTLIFDDWFEGPETSDSAVVTALVEGLLTVVHDRPDSVTSSSLPLVRSFADIWKRSIEGMPEWWRSRAAHHWEIYVCANAHEAVERDRKSSPQLDQFLIMRRGTVCLENYIDLTERLGGRVLSARAFHIPQLRLMREIATLVPALTNDVVTLPKEEALGEVNNLVLVLEHSHGCGREEALALAREMIGKHVNRFVGLAHDVPALCREFGLPDAERDAVIQYVDAQRLWMGGFEEWSQHTERYVNQVGLI